jgi:hypothetical protein
MSKIKCFISPALYQLEEPAINLFVAKLIEEARENFYDILANRINKFGGTMEDMSYYMGWAAADVAPSCCIFDAAEEVEQTFGIELNSEFIYDWIAANIWDNRNFKEALLEEMTDDTDDLIDSLVERGVPYDEINED